MQEELKKLIALQASDLQIKALEDELAAGQKEIENRIEAIEEKKAEIEELSARIEDNKKERKELETGIEDNQAHIKNRQSRLMTIQTNREYQSLLKEIEETKTRIKEQEEKIVNLMELDEDIQKRLVELKNLTETGENLLKEEKEKVEKLSVNVNKKKTTIEKKRDKQAKDIPANLKSRYNQLRSNRNGVAIVGVTNSVCQGCFMNIPPQQYNEVLRGEQLIACPSCQRIMYHQSEEEN
ncbi:MAG: zinc ribbon domain-containing protein [Thermodesulfobacteriota bacterium]